MNYEIEQFGLDLGTTSFENMFINTYLSLATGNQLKVYIYAYAHASSNSGEELTNEDIANQMDISLEEVNDAWDFWIDLSAVDKVDNKYVFKSLRSNYIKQLLDHKNTDTIDNENIESFIEETVNRQLTSDEIRENQDFRKLLFNIENFIQAGRDIPIKLKEDEIRMVESFIKEFKLNIDFIQYAFPLASTTVNSKNPKFIMGVIRNWVIDGATDIESLNKLLDSKIKAKQKNPLADRKKIKKKSKNLSEDRYTNEEKEKILKKKMQKRDRSNLHGGED